MIISKEFLNQFVFDRLVGVTPGKLPRAILPPQRTFWGAILDTVVGDGPSKR